MPSYLPLRLAAACLTLAIVAAPPAARGQPAGHAAQTGAAATPMDHISIVSQGDGPPVVLIPGLSSPRETWAAVAPALARSHRVLMVQVNGFGGDAPGANLAPGILDGVVADLHAYLGRERLTAPAVIGHSLGGLIAMKLAIAHPGDVGRLMIVDTLPFYGRLFGPAMTPAILQPRAAAMRDAMAAGYGKPADPAAGEAITNGLALHPDARAKVKAWVATADPRVSAEAMYEDLQTDVTPDLPKIAAPITLVVPLNDALPQAKVHALYQDAYAPVRELHLVEVPEAAHFVMLDQPAIFARTITDFLAR